MIILSVLHNIAHCQSFLAARLFAFSQAQLIQRECNSLLHIPPYSFCFPQADKQRAEVRFLHAVG